MKRSFLALLSAALLAAGCSPQTYSLYLDVRQPSPSGLDLSRKSLSIAYLEGTNSVDSLFDRSAASAMARSLEADYFGGEERVGLYSVPTPDTVSVELMRSLVMDTGGDVVFLLTSRLGEPNLESNQPFAGATSPDSAYVCMAAVPVRTQLYVYDSMAQDKVFSFKGKTVMRCQVYNSGIGSEESLKILSLHQVGPEADAVGQRVSTHFLSDWRRDTFSFYYFNDTRSETWVQALSYAQDGNFARAIDLWGQLLGGGNRLKKACACYNMAMAFYLLEDLTLASGWLEECDKLENVPLSKGLRKRIDTRLEKLQK